MSDNLVYLAVLKASYDYDPQSDDELPIKENQLLLLLDREDDDWWKVKIKSDAAEDEGPSGLVPAAYVEPADHVSVVKVLYDYEATSPGELSVQEDEILLVYETDQDWVLVQSHKDGGKVGYVPGNYVETSNEEESTQPISVDVPTARPVSTYIDPADRVASSKVAQSNVDSIKTWPVTNIDKKGKKKKGTLGVGNGAIFFASESDKTPVQKWQANDISDAVIEKGKQVRLDIGGNNPITLHYNTGSKDNAEAILEKIQSLKSLSDSRTSHDLPINGPSTSSVSPIGRKMGKKVSVHFSQSDPIIIPAREEEEEEGEEGEGEGGREDLEDPSEVQGDGEEVNEEPGEDAVALYDFSADGDDELSVKEGEKLRILEKDGDEWWKCTNSRGGEGVVPASYLQVQVTPQPVNSPPLPSRANVTAEREAAAAARESAQRVEEDRRQRKEEQIQLEKVRKKREAQRAKEAAAAATEAEKKKVKMEVARSSPPATQTPVKQSNENGSAGRQSTELKFPPQDQVRTWLDRSGQFRVDAAFLGLSNNKIRLHKINGVIVEVPTERMSVDDMRFVERLQKKSLKSNQRLSDDDVPLAVSRAQSSQRPAAQKKHWDWFEFFLSAGCDLDDCTRYAASFEKDKIDEAILPDITESTMRTLGLREGDIIRVNKAIEKRKPDGHNSKQTNARVQDQIRHDEELARQLQAQENGGSSPRSPAPNLFAGPGGILKAPRKRPQPTKSLPPNVDIKALSNASDEATSPPQANNASSSTPVQPPARISSAAPVASGFDDDAWTNRSNFSKPLSSTPPAATPRAPLSAPVAPSNVTTIHSAAPTPPPQSTNTAPDSVLSGVTANPSLAKTTEANIFDQLARLSELRGPGTPSGAPRSGSSPAITSPPPTSYQAGLGMGPSPVPIGQHLQNQQLQSQQPRLIPSPSQVQVQSQPQPYNGPRGPFAPVPANQGLLQPLVPTQTNFNGFVPTRPISNNMNVTVAALPPAPQPFLPVQSTGLPNQVILPHTTGVPFSGFASTTVASSTFQGPGGFNTLPTPMQPHFNPGVGQFPSNFSAAPMPPLPASVTSPTKDTSPASVFAQMKSGTFANEDTAQAQLGEKYDALQSAPLLPQPTGWATQYQTGFIGYPS